MSDRGRYNERLKALMAFTNLRASMVGQVMATPLPGFSPPRLESGHRIVSVRLNGMAELQAGASCDQCLRYLEAKSTVFGKTVNTRRESAVFGKSAQTFSAGVIGAFFSPTCISCFVEDRGGYYSTVLAALVMEA